ncbi:MAG: metalloregulator ArsR/SmtB family transcription factor [Haloarculaceae archaeon]
MDSAELLDLLGNANRRRILRLLAHKPCYVTEISEYLGVSPKAVIDHLEKLESAGLVESRTDERRRKYFSIARNLRLEVQVSPYEFGTKSAYPASPGLDVNSCRYLSIEVSDDGGESVRDLARQLERLEQLENELSMAQRWVQGRLTDVRERIDETVDDEDGRLYAELIGALVGGPRGVSSLARRLEVPPPVLEDALERLAREGVVERRGDEWALTDRG